MSNCKIVVKNLETNKVAKIKDPYIVVKFKGIKKQTKVSPLKGPFFDFNETLIFDVNGDPSPGDVVEFHVYEDEFMRDKLIGTTTTTFGNLKSGKSLPVSKKGKVIPDTKVGASASDAGDKKEFEKGGNATVGDNNDTKSKDEGFAEGSVKEPSGSSGQPTNKTDRSTLSEKPEDFQVRVKIICGRQLSGSNIKPVVKVKGGKRTKATRVRKGSSPEFNEMLMFQYSHISLKDLYETVFEFTVNNSRKMRSDALIGSFKLDVGSVYDQPDHAYVRKWILLTEPEDTTNTPKGYLKITICVLGAGDQPPDDKGDEDDEDVEGNLLTPAGAALRSATFKLIVYKGEDFPQMDSAAFQNIKGIFSNKAGSELTGSTLVDPYLSLSFGGKKTKTKVIQQCNSPSWNEELSLPLKFPSMCDSLKMVVKDWDRVGNAEPIGAANILISRISSTGEETDSDSDDDEYGGFLPTFGPTFVNFYGSPREFSAVTQSLDDLNAGKGEGCAYRGRVLVELKTSLDEEDSEPTPKAQPIPEEAMLDVEKYMRRRRYRLVVAFESAGMMTKSYEDVEFEVSIGNVGNKFETKGGPPFVSCTDSVNTMSDGHKFRFIPWAAKKPVIVITSEWEDITFRLYSKNLILRFCERLREELDYIKSLVKNEEPEVQIAAEIVDTLDMVLVETAIAFPSPRGNPMANQLDIRLWQQRVMLYKVMGMEARVLRESCTDAQEAISALEDFYERLVSSSYEPQNSLPDIIIWMISDDERIAYAKIQANEILYSNAKPEFCGKQCGTPQDITFKIPTPKATSKKHQKVPCRARIMAWLGLASDQSEFKLDTCAQMSVFASTYEVEKKIPVKGWTADGYFDITGDIELPKNKFTCPTGWEWGGDWEMSKERTAFSHAGKSDAFNFLEECYEIETIEEAEDGEESWNRMRVESSKGKEIESLDDIKCPNKWQWSTEWWINTTDEVDEEGYEYTADEINDPGEISWNKEKKSYHIYRRKRWVRQRTLTDKKAIRRDEKAGQRAEEGWEYGTSMGSQFHAKPSALDFVRRRHWMKKMITIQSEEGSLGSAAIFNLNPTEKKEKKIASAEAMDINEDEQSLLMGEEKQIEEEGIISPQVKEESSGGFFSFGGKKTVKLPPPKVFLDYGEPFKLQLRAYIYQARDMLPMDQDSFSDPFVYVSFLNETKKTKYIEHTLNPVWDQSLIIDINYFGDLNHLDFFCPEVNMEFYDKNELGKMEFMGRAYGKVLLKLDPTDETKPQLQWHTINKGSQFGGSVLASFELYLKRENFELPALPRRREKVLMVPFGIRPILQRTALEFVIWGVRSMKKFQLLSVDSPSVLIQLADVEIRTKIIKKVKKNPNFKDPLFFLTANLPVKELYFPPIIIRVKDNRKFGRRPTVGQHIITNSSKYRIEPPKTKDEAQIQYDEGFDDLDDVSPETCIEIDLPTEKVGATKESSGNFLSSILSIKEAKPTIREDEIDWWSKFYASTGDSEKTYEDSGLDLITVYKGPLENQEEYNEFSDLIQTFKLFRGKNDDDEEPEVVGEFKGTFRIYSLPSDPTIEMPPKYFQNLPSTDPVEVQCIVYIVRAFDLAPQDDNGLADPYIKIKYGREKISDRKNYIANTLEPTFGRVFRFNVKLPMEKDLTVQVFDWDLIGTDDKIGQTTIDLENRYYTKYRAWCGLPKSYYTSGPFVWRDQKLPKEWLDDRCRANGWDDPVWNGNTSVLVNKRTYNLSDFESEKAFNEFWGEAEERLSLYILRTFPHIDEHVETRPLYTNVMPNIEQGRLQMWVDMFPKEHGEPHSAFTIEPRKPSKYYVRVVIWNCTDIPFMDTSFTGEQMSDIYMKGWISGLENKKQKTDVHYRSLDGTGMFNWRFVFEIDYLPQERMVHVTKKEHLWSLDKTVTKFAPVLNIQAWDNDLFGPNEYISEISLPLCKMAKCCKFKRMCKIENVPDIQGNCKMDILSLFDQKLLKGWWPLYKQDKDGKKVQAGKLEMSVEICTEEEHEEKPCAKARDEPNMNPKLEKPKRPATSFAWFSSPFKSFRYIIWRKYKWFIIGFLLLLLLVAFIVLMVYAFPQLISKKVIDAITGTDDKK